MEKNQESVHNAKTSSQTNHLDLIHIEKVIEVCLLTATDSINLNQISNTFDNAISDEILTEIINRLKLRYNESGLELMELSSGYRFRSKIEFQPYLNKLYQIKPIRYSRAIMETLAIIVYRQPVTRGEIEDIRGVSVSSAILQTIMEREWVEVIGQKQIPGRPELLATTTKFLEEFGINSLQDLPPLPYVDSTQFKADNDLIEEYDNAKQLLS